MTDTVFDELDCTGTLPCLPGVSDWYNLSEEMFHYFISKGITIDTDISVKNDFREFLILSESRTIRLDGYCTGGFDVDGVHLGYDNDSWCALYISGLHRWKREYKKRVYAKVQCLNAWYDTHHSPITMCTFTTYQRGLDKWEQLELLKCSFNKAKKMLNKYLGLFSYVWVMEPHDSGYSHIHMILFKSVSRELRKKLQTLWIEKYNPGASLPGQRYGESLNFKIKKGQRDLRSAAAYIFAYVNKTLDYELLEQFDSGYYLQSAWVWKMSKHDTDYTGVRLWGCSRDLSEVMKSPDLPPSECIWWRVNYFIPADSESPGGWYPLWIDGDIAAYPERVSAFDYSLSEVLRYNPGFVSSKEVIRFLGVA